MNISKGDWVTLSHLKDRKAEVKSVENVEGKIHVRLHGYEGVYEVKEVVAERVIDID